MQRRTRLKQIAAYSFMNEARWNTRRIDVLICVQ